MAERRGLTAAELDEKRRLNHIWATKGKEQKKLTQQKAANALGITQSAFSQYLKQNYAHGETGIPLNTDFVRSFCKLVGAKPSEISERFLDIDAFLSKTRGAVLPVTRLLTGEHVKEYLAVNLPAIPDDVYGIRVNVNGHAGLVEDQYIIIDPRTIPHEGDNVVLVSKEKVVYGKLNLEDGEWRITTCIDGVFRSITITKNDTIHFVSAVQNEPNKGNKPFSI